MSPVFLTTSRKDAKGAQRRGGLFAPLRVFLGAFAGCIIPLVAPAQTDTTRAELNEVTVRAFGEASRLRAPASIAILDSLAFIRSAEFSIVPAMNRLPGVRMDERSPGSYRISLRGSTLRSPFGVRNVKIYYDDIPLTDPGGHTYFNALSPAQIGRIEIAKGPAGSLYGAGTGGVMLVESPGRISRGTGAEVRTLVGAYGHLQGAASASFATEKSSVAAQYTHRQLDGYRAHSALRHDVGSLQASRSISPKLSIGTTLLASHLFYQTPGGLTATEAAQNPRAARPAAGQSMGAQQADAHIMQTNLLAGARVVWSPSPQWSGKTILYGALADLVNPAIRNWGAVDEGHTGARSVWSYRREIRGKTFRLDAGAEYQSGRSDAQTFENRRGERGALQAHEEARVRTGFLFAQAALQTTRWNVSAGLSANSRSIRFVNRFVQPAESSTRDFGIETAPRLSVAWYAAPTTTVYALAARGFSPPALPELSPTGSGLNTDLRAEGGWNYEAGVRGRALQNRLRWEGALFLFSLEDAIVSRRDALGGDYFLNAGGTRQAGLEAQIEALLLQRSRWTLAAWSSYAYNHFRYTSFVQGTDDFSGNALPGISPHTGSAGIDAAGPGGLALHLTYSAAGRQTLNDGATAWANAYHLLGARAGVQKSFRSGLRAELSAGVENLLDGSYSLGNDINAFGGRAYNPAAGRAFYAGLVVGWQK